MLLSCHETSFLYAFIKKKVAGKPFSLHNIFFSLSHFSDSGLPKISRGGEKSDNHFVQGQDHEEDS